MARYFIEVAYKGTAYAGFQVQQNANTIQAEVEKALTIYYRTPFELTGSSRTDAGVHAHQNFFHTDTNHIIDSAGAQKAVYHINAILPGDIVMKGIHRVKDEAHARFDALSRSYIYRIYQQKDPFLEDRAYYYPFTLNKGMLDAAASLLKEHSNFESFAKKNSQVFTYECSIIKSEWKEEENGMSFHVTGNRFLRGMVRGLTGTMLLAGRNKYSVEDFRNIIISRDQSKTDFSAPAKGLFLREVIYPSHIFEK